MNHELPMPDDAVQTGQAARVLVQRMVRAIGRFLRENGYAVFMGAALNWLGYDITNWRTYVFMLPMVILVAIRRPNDRTERPGP